MTESSYQRTPFTTRIDWRCDKCGRLISDGRGAVWITYGDIRRASDAVARDTQQSSVSVAEIVADMTHGPSWRVTHDVCEQVDPDVDGCYDIAIGEIRDHHAFLRWTRHLMAKTWFSESNWEGVIARALNEGRD